MITLAEPTSRPNKAPLRNALLLARRKHRDLLDKAADLARDIDIMRARRDRLHIRADQALREVEQLEGALR